MFKSSILEGSNQGGTVQEGETIFATREEIAKDS